MSAQISYQKNNSMGVGTYPQQAPSCQVVLSSLRCLVITKKMGLEVKCRPSKSKYLEKLTNLLNYLDNRSCCFCN
ncbi:unnamed protein product [Moneuplotes crassus]|uniref:Uncharacterized protein n=1 Tax=Euplotes crassus TaxID=5936 RepID=A0AAD2D4K7_EUPCR|nr:unnamed protein product [Moneuplotes crassus]